MGVAWGGGEGEGACHRCDKEGKPRRGLEVRRGRTGGWVKGEGRERKRNEDEIKNGR